MRIRNLIRQHLASALAIFVGVLTAVFAAHSADTKTEKTRGLNVTREVRLQSSATVLSKDGKVRPVKAALRRWIIPGKQLAELDERGFLLIQLRGGKVTVTIDGKEQKHAPGDFWVVPANSRMTIQVTTETAGLDVLSLDIR